MQRIQNESRPVPVPHRPARREIPVRARIVWEHDGEEWIDAVAQRWTSSHVLIRGVDPLRWPAGLVWLDADDVQPK